MALPFLMKQPFTTIGRWAFLSGQVAVVQVLVQGVNAVTGLLLVRYLPKDEYAWFTLAGSLIATLNLLGDGGVSTGLTSIGGQIHNQHGPFARLIHDGLHISRWLCLMGFALASPLFFGLFTNIKAPPWVTWGALILAATVAWPSVYIVILNVANRLHKRVQVVQMAELSASLTRLTLTGSMLLFGWWAALPALLATVTSSWVQAGIIYVRTRSFLRFPSLQVSFRKPLRVVVGALYANNVFICLQAQVATWVVGWLAGSDEMADIGALSRMSVIFAAISSPFYYLAFPAFARAQNIARLRYIFFLSIGMALLAVGSVIFIAWLFPNSLLWLLGGKYSHLTSELPLALAGQGIAFLNTFFWGVLMMRGWLKRVWISIPLTVAGYAVGALLFDLRIVSGLLKFTLFSTVPSVVFGVALVLKLLVMDDLKKNKRP